MLGDGDFMMAPGAIWSAAHMQAPLLVVILNNHSWGNDELHQREVAHQRDRDPSRAHIGQRTEKPHADIASIARGFGAWAPPRVEDPAKLADVLSEAVARVKQGEIAVVEVITALE